MSELSVAFVGTGPEPDNPVWGESAAMAYRHADAYDGIDRCELVACADLVRENALAFAEEFDIPEGNVFEDYGELLAAADPDVVSVCTPVPTHADIVVDLAESGIPDAIHCEKPMADTWGEAKRMAAACEEAGVQLTFNHQRRFGPEWREAKALLDDGAVGDLERLEMGGKNMFDYGSHLVDLCHFFNGETDVEWVLGGIDYTEENVRYGVHNENRAVSLWQYENGVACLATTGDEMGDEVAGCENRIRGSDGVIEVNPTGERGLRVRRAGDAGWERVETEDVGDLIGPAIEHVVESLAADEEPELGARNALRATEVLFATYESARRRGRVDLPLDVEDNPLTALVEAGDLSPESAGE